MKRPLEFTDTALKTLARMRNVDRKFILDGIKLHLIENDALEMTRNKFRLRRSSLHAESELRLGEWRVFYSVPDNFGPVVVNLIGHKRGDKLIINGEEFEL